MEENVCNLCLESLDKCTVVHLNCCSGQRIHIQCYSKSLPRCPFCRKDQPEILPRVVIVTDWPKVTRFILTSFFMTSCVTMAIIMNAKCAEN